MNIAHEWGKLAPCVYLWNGISIISKVDTYKDRGVTTESQGRSSCALTYDFVVERGCNKLPYDAVVCDSRVH